MQHWTLCLHWDTLRVCCRNMSLDAQCVSRATMCGWRHIVCLEKHFVSDTMRIWRHNVCVETM